MQPFAIESLLQEATRRTGLSDFGPPDFLEALRVLLESLNGAGSFSEQRRPAVEERLLRLLSNRLWFALDLAEHPEILDEALGSPVFIVSLPRTGSTKLHRLLGAGGDFQTLPFWKVHQFARLPGAPDAGSAQRISATEAYEQWMYATSPEILTGHPMFTHEAEEDQWLGEPTFREPLTAALFNVPAYGEWLMQSDPQPVHDYLVQQLKYLQWQFKPERPTPWLLKSPPHLGNECHLTRAFDRPRFIVTHRDPLACVPSITTTTLAMRRLYDEHADVSGLGPALTGLIAHMANRHVAWRAANPDVEVLDLGFREISGDGIAAARKVYDFCGLDWSDAAERRMRQWERDNHADKHGKNRYSLEMIGVSAETLQNAFASYIDRYIAYI